MSVDQASVGQIDDAEDESLSCLLADLDEVCDRFEVAWRSGEPPLIEDSLKDVPEPLRPFFLRELVALDVAYRRQVGQTPCRAEYEQRFQQHARAVREAFGGDGDGAITPVYHLAEARRLAEPAIASGRLEVRCPHCRAPGLLFFR